MIGTRTGSLRWIVAPLFVAIVWATSARAEVTFSHVGSADAADPLFKSVVDQGANPRSTEGTVTETASQARAAEVAASRPIPMAEPSRTAPESAPAPAVQAPAARATRMAALSPVLPARRGVVAIHPSQELLRLRQENLALKKLLADLSDRGEPAAGRPEVRVLPPGRARLSAIAAVRRTE